MLNLSQQGKPGSCLGSKKKFKAKPKSRNTITSARTTAVLTLSKPILRSISPITRTSTQRSNKSNSSLSLREKSLINQNLKLKKENEKLIQLIKKSKTFIKDEIKKYHSENLVMKKFLMTAWPLVGGQIDQKLAENLKPILESEHISKTLKVKSENVLRENHTKNIEIVKEKSEIIKLEEKLNNEKQLNHTVIRYLNFLENRVINTNKNINEDIIPVDSSNLLSDEGDEIIEESGKEFAIPGFIKSLHLGNQ